MSFRASFWLLGLALVSALAAYWPWAPQWRGLAALCMLLALGSLGFVLDLAGAFSPARRPREERPADGKVDRVALAACRTEPNTVDGRFRRFTGLQPLEPGSAAQAQAQARGSSPDLLGHVAIVSLFADRDGQPWSDAEIATAQRSLLHAAGWIEQEALRWHAAVNLDLADVYFAVDDGASPEVEIGFVLEGDHQAPFEAHAVPKALASFSRAARGLGFADAADLIARVAERVAADCWIWVLHVRSAGRSLAVPEADTPWPGVTLTVCYAQEATFPEPLTKPPLADTATFAHELLHLFGATDKYGVSLSTFPPKTVTDRDIMCLNYSSLGRMRVDPGTAAEIGWNSGIN